MEKMPGAGVVNLIVLPLILSALLLLPAASASDDCVYTIYVRTGSIWKGGTDSVISLALADAGGVGLNITNLEEYGLMGENHDYYERGNLDIFSLRGPCLRSKACWMELVSDGSGPGHGWYCNYVEVTSTGPHIPCAQQLFTVEQWLALDTSPYRLTATRDYCGEGGAGSRKVLRKMEAAVGGGGPAVGEEKGPGQAKMVL